MTPLFGCFPLCLTFVIIAMVGLVAVAVVGVNREGPNLSDDAAAAAPTPPGHGPPSWRVVVLIFAVVLLHFLILLLVWPEL